MAIKVGDKLPQATFRVMTADGPAAKTTDDLFKGRKIVLFAVPGAFTPTCSLNHLPGFLENRDSFFARGVDEIVVLSVNDHHVMQAWAKASGGEGKIRFFADGSAIFTKAIGLENEMNGMGIRSKRYSMLIEDGKVTQFNIETVPGQAEVSGAATLLGQL
ncbi:MAG: peroxiredoxin [Hyphomicrobiales bacterium]|nr:MAG: peroxiredoxin [Hyphomicrobiales bacterium]